MDNLIKKTIKKLKEDYGARCKVRDWQDFPEGYKTPKELFKERRCSECVAADIIQLLKTLYP